MTSSSISLAPGCRRTEANHLAHCSAMSAASFALSSVRTMTSAHDPATSDGVFTTIWPSVCTWTHARIARAIGCPRAHHGALSQLCNNFRRAAKANGKPCGASPFASTKSRVCSVPPGTPALPVADRMAILAKLAIVARTSRARHDHRHFRRSAEPLWLVAGPRPTRTRCRDTPRSHGRLRGSCRPLVGRDCLGRTPGGRRALVRVVPPECRTVRRRVCTVRR